MKSQQRRTAPVAYSFSAGQARDQVSSTPKKGVSSKPGATSQSGSGAGSAAGSGASIFAYDTKLIFQDLKRTILITAGILLLLGIAAFYLK